MARTGCWEIQESISRTFLTPGSFFPRSYGPPRSHLHVVISQMIAENFAVYEPAKQPRSIRLYWRPCKKVCQGDARMGTSRQDYSWLGPSTLIIGPFWPGVLQLPVTPSELSNLSTPSLEKEMRTCRQSQSWNPREAALTFCAWIRNSGCLKGDG